MHSSQIINRQKVINIGILGYASIAKNKVIPAILSEKEKFKLIGIASRDLKYSKEIINNYKCEFFNDYDTLINNPSLDAIYIPLPNALHFLWAKKCLQRGLHILLEKPSTCNYQDTIELVNIANSSHLSFVETFQFRFHKQFELIKTLIKDETIGELRNIRSSFGFPKIDYPNNIRYLKKLGGGSLFDAGVYPLKISSLILGNQISVKSAMLYKCPLLDIDMRGDVFLQDKNFISSQISFGFDNYYQCTLDIWGSKGKITANRIFTAPNDLDIYINLETKDFKKNILVGKDDHFRNLLSYFHKTIFNRNLATEELKLILKQSKLVNEIQVKATLS